MVHDTFLHNIGASEFHASAKRQHTSGMRWQSALLTDMQGGELQSEVEQIRSIIAEPF